jgi:3-hydroxyacyl-[acyl-carrier-protein] dehydratase
MTHAKATIAKLMLRPAALSKLASEYYQHNTVKETSTMNAVQLPCPAEKFVPHRPPMLLVTRLLERQHGNALIEAMVPGKGIWLDPQSRVLPEYYIELVAQAMAAVNGYDAVRAGKAPGSGMLVGIDDYRLVEQAVPGETVWIDVEKTFEFGAVKIIRGAVRNARSTIADVELKVWEGEVPGAGS